MQRDLDRLECWAVLNCIKLNKSKCWILPLGRGNPEYTCRLADERLESSPAKKELGVLVDGKLERSQHFWAPQQKEGT